ncbi:MAG: (2Fe-2S) ferredoxin domain-containing protein [Acidobacteria bacterium]|nr:MAG: (2Fe-2S) ferredoxin domain-containing protein [Acidobacteriota bacterium]
MPKPRKQILVCVNERPETSPKPSCARRGSYEVYRRFKDVVRARGLRDGVMVTKTGCLKHCSRGITVCIWPDAFWYGGVTLDDVEEIVDRSLARDEEVARLRMPDIPWE